MIIAVLDTNVLVSAFPAPGGVPATLVDAWRQGKYRLVVSEAILEEDAVVTPITVEVTGVATHPEDDRILATAVVSRAAFLVTGDRKLQAIGTFRGVSIISPREFLERLTLVADHDS